MRIAFVGVSHWHQSLYIEPALEVPGAEIVAVSDPDSAAVATWANRLGCKGFMSFGELCEQVRPDFVFALGRHCDMADEARYLIDAGIPFVLEKPCGVSAAELRDLVTRRDAKDAFAAVSFVFRNGELLQELQALHHGDRFSNLSFHFIAGFPSRYQQTGCEWMLSRELAGGGTTLNLSVHFFDLCRLLLGGDARVVSAAMSNAAWGHDIEDHSAVVLGTGRGMCLVETGYLFPAPTSTFDLHYAARSNSSYCAVRDAQTMEVFDNAGTSEVRRVSSTNVPHYRDFVHDVLDRARRGQAPRAGLDDMLAVMELAEQAYALCHERTGQRFNCAAGAP